VVGGGTTGADLLTGTQRLSCEPCLDVHSLKGQGIKGGRQKFLENCETQITITVLTRSHFLVPYASTEISTANEATVTPSDYGQNHVAGEIQDFNFEGSTMLHQPAGTAVVLLNCEVHASARSVED
jgi:hypothetical protein